MLLQYGCTEVLLWSRVILLRDEESGLPGRFKRTVIRDEERCGTWGTEGSSLGPSLRVEPRGPWSPTLQRGKVPGERLRAKRNGTVN